MKTLDRLKNLKIRAATRLNSRMLAALGATPVQMPLPAVPEAMARRDRRRHGALEACGGKAAGDR